MQAAIRKRRKMLTSQTTVMECSGSQAVLPIKQQKARGAKYKRPKSLEQPL